MRTGDSRAVSRARRLVALTCAAVVVAACEGAPTGASEDSATACADGSDNDGDGATDCSDSDCVPFCMGEDAGARPDSSLPPVGPCGSVPEWGRCASASRVEYCVVPTGSAVPYLDGIDCPVGTACDATGAEVYCRPTGECLDGAVQCADAVNVQQCVAGTWQTAACPTSCVSTAVGDGCAPDVATAPISGTVVYEARGPNAGFTDWDAIVQAPAVGFLVLSMRGGTETIDAVVTGSSGEFTIQVPTAPGADDAVVIFAAGVASDGSLAFLVADPGYPASTEARDVGAAPPSPSAWAWQFGTASLTDGATLPIPESAGSGAARVFDYLRYVYGETEAFFHPAHAQSIVVWLGMQTSWSCGACVVGAPTRAFDLDFTQQAFIAGGPDAGYWSDAVTAHEFGHYVMGAYGRAVGEGGPHFVGGVSNPGLAWSEGWATFFSSDIRASSVYYDKQQGGFFWFDVAARNYSSATWNRPSASGDLLQPIDENEVAAMLWSLDQQVGRDAMWGTLSDPRIVAEPFERGYTARYWMDPAHPEIYEDTGRPAPFVADFFDAAICAGRATADQVDGATEPTAFYPYPSRSPLCR